LASTQKQPVQAEAEIDIRPEEAEQRKEALETPDAEGRMQTSDEQG
jgi:hypothetical protein